MDNNEISKASLIAENRRKCRFCNAIIDFDDVFCKHCGGNQKKATPFLQREIGIVLLTILGGPISLPFLWKSKTINQNRKIIYTILILLFTIYLIYWTISFYTKTMADINNIIGGQTGIESIGF